MHHSDFCISGAGIIGLSLALELHRRGATVTVLDQGEPLAEASTAAAGMLAANDPDNPPLLQALSDLSSSLYPTYLAYIESLSQIPVPFQTSTTLQALALSHPSTVESLTNDQVTGLLPQLEPRGYQFIRLAEHSVDPGQLAPSLLAAVRATSIELQPHTPVRIVRGNKEFAEIHTSTSTLTAANYIDCSGAWAISLAHTSPNLVVPKKGQILSVILPPSLPLSITVRTPEVYILPRTVGPQAGRALIGATVEDKGFDTSVDPEVIDNLHASAAKFLPALKSADVLESWAGIRPATPDRLPFLGPLPDRLHSYIAAGHYRNGVLLAPATAHVMAQLLCSEVPSVDLANFSPGRLLAQPMSNPSPIAH